MERMQGELVAAAARLVVEEGLEYGPAKHRAARQLGVRGALPGNEELEAAVREHIELFCPDTQPSELRELRRLALVWMERLERFRPHLSGAVWHGTATRLSDIHIELYCDDPKEAEIALIDHGVGHQPDTISGRHGQAVPVLLLAQRSDALGVVVTVRIAVLGYDDLRGALRQDAQGRKPRGDLDGVRALAGKPAALAAVPEGEP